MPCNAHRTPKQDLIFFQWSSIWWSCIEIAAWMLLIHGISSVKCCSFLIALAATSHSICGLRQYNQQWLGNRLVFSSLTWSKINVTEYTLTDCNGLGQTKWIANISKHKHALSSSRTHHFQIWIFRHSKIYSSSNYCCEPFELCTFC